MFRDRLTDQSDITASSEFGVEGRVAINNVGIDVSSGLVSLPTQFSDVDDQVTASCSNIGGNQFVASGQGGIATNPSDHTPITRVWQDLRQIETLEHSAVAENTAYPINGLEKEPASESVNAPITAPINAPINAPAEIVIQEASNWKQNPSGQIELIAIENNSHLLAPNCLTSAS